MLRRQLLCGRQSICRDGGTRCINGIAECGHTRGTVKKRDLPLVWRLRVVSCQWFRRSETEAKRHNRFLRWNFNPLGSGGERRRLESVVMQNCPGQRPDHGVTSLGEGNDGGSNYESALDRIVGNDYRCTDQPTQGLVGYGRIHPARWGRLANHFLHDGNHLLVSLKGIDLYSGEQGLSKAHTTHQGQLFPRRRWRICGMTASRRWHRAPERPCHAPEAGAFVEWHTDGRSSRPRWPVVVFFEKDEDGTEYVGLWPIAGFTATRRKP